MSFKCEVSYTVVRPFRATAETSFAAGDEYPYMGNPGDEKLVRVGYVEQTFAYQCRRGRCKQSFGTISELLEHEATHDE